MNVQKTRTKRGLSPIGDNYQTIEALIQTTQFPDWPLMEVVSLLGECRQRLIRYDDKKPAEKGPRYSYQGSPLDRIHKRYGRMFMRYSDAVPFLEEMVEAERQIARDRAASYRANSAGIP